MDYSEEISFDPRLREYLRKKKYYVENHIIPCIPLEKEYMITYDDIQKIKKHINNQKMGYYIPKEKLVVTKSPQSIKSGMTQKDIRNIEPKILYKKKIHFVNLDGSSSEMEHNPRMDEIIEYMKEKTEVPAFLSQCITKNKSKRLYTDPQTNPNSCVNEIREQYYNNIDMDADILNDMKLGMPPHTRKTYGYDDPFEHYMDYIDGEIQEPEHVIMDFPRGGDSARLANKQQTQRSRQIY